MNDKDYIQIKVRIRRSHEPTLFQYFDAIPQQWRAEMVRRVLLTALARSIAPKVVIDPSPSPPSPPVAPARPVAAQEPPPSPVQKSKVPDEALARIARLNRFD